MYCILVFLFFVASSTFAQQTHNRRICEGSSIGFTCGVGEVIGIAYANYGRTVAGSAICPMGDATYISNCKAANSINIVRKLCENREKCTVSASNTVFGDPCQGWYKYLEIEYICKKPKIVCEDATLKLECGPNEVINITSANYGRTAPGDVLCQLKDHDSFTNCFAPNSLDVVKRTCNKHQSCSIHAHNSVFGDPCVGTRKYLEVNYRCEKGTPISVPPAVTPAVSPKVPPTVTSAVSPQSPPTVTPKKNEKEPVVVIGNNTVPAAILEEIKKASGMNVFPINALIYINHLNVFQNMCDVHLNYNSNGQVSELPDVSAVPAN